VINNEYIKPAASKGEIRYTPKNKKPEFYNSGPGVK